MSLILDALNKSERERTEQNNTVNIHSVHVSSSEDAQRLRNRRWMWEVFVIVFLLLGFYLYTQWIASPAGTPAPASESTAAVPTVLPVSPAPSLKTQPQLKPQLNPQLNPQPQQEPQPQLKPEPASGTQSNNATATDEKNQPAAGVSKAVRQLYEQPPQPEVIAVERKQVEVKKPQQAVVDANAQWVSVPLISQLPRTVSSNIASIDFSIHMYSDQEGASFVHLNGELRREGDTVAPGLRLVKIFEYGIVLDYQGTQFRLLPLSGWINM